MHRVLRNLEFLAPSLCIALGSIQRTSQEARGVRRRRRSVSFVQHINLSISDVRTWTISSLYLDRYECETHAETKESRKTKRQGENKLDVDVLVAVRRIGRIVAFTLPATGGVGEGDRHLDVLHRAEMPRRASRVVVGTAIEIQFACMTWVVNANSARATQLRHISGFTPASSLSTKPPRNLQLLDVFLAL